MFMVKPYNTANQTWTPLIRWMRNNMRFWSFSEKISRWSRGRELLANIKASRQRKFKDGWGHQRELGIRQQPSYITLQLEFKWKMREGCQPTGTRRACPRLSSHPTSPHNRSPYEYSQLCTLPHHSNWDVLWITGAPHAAGTHDALSIFVIHVFNMKC